MPNLHGSVPDANAVVLFLKDRVGVEDNRIKILRDEEATRKNITESLIELASCKDVEKGDPILIYYGGHGVEADPPAGWPSGGPRSKIQMLAPYDFFPSTTKSLRGQGIPDFSLSILLSQIAKTKGDNIVSSSLTVL